MNISKFDQLKFVLFIMVLVIIEIFINNSTTVYVDLLGIVLVVLLLDGYTFKNIILISLIADLIGHWYIGSHLLSVLLLSFMTVKVERFYSICGFWQKTMLLISFYSILFAILSLTSWITQHYVFNFKNYIAEIIIFLPFVNYVIIKIKDKSHDELIY